MFPAVLFGALGGVLAARFALHRRAWHRGGGCGGHRGFGGHGFDRHGVSRRDAYRYFRLVRGLDLSREQRRAVRDVVVELRDTMEDARDLVRGEIDPVIAAVAAEDFDRAVVERSAAHGEQGVRAIRDRFVEATERLHAILTPEQRARLRERLGAAPAAAPPAEGPYR